MPTIIDTIPRVLEMWKEINPKAQEKTLHNRGRQLEILHSNFSFKHLHDITLEDIMAFVKLRESEGVKRATVMIQLRALEDAFLMAGQEKNPAREALGLLLKRRSSLRHKGQPDYARRRGYEIHDRHSPPRNDVEQEQPTSIIELPNIHDLREKVSLGSKAMLVCNNTRIGLEGDNTAAILLDAAVEMERMAKKGHKSFIVLFE